MKESERMALVHMLLAQREQINASLRMLMPAPAEHEKTESKRPRYMGDDEPPQTNGGA